MDEKELLKKAFEYGNVPSLITYCFTEPCPMKNKCIHYLSALYKNEKTDRGDAIFPNALKNGECKYCRNNRHISNSSSPDTDIKMLNSTISLKKLISLKANLFLSPPDVLSMPFKRSHREHVTGYR